MEQSSQTQIIAIISTTPQTIQAGSGPVFTTDNQEELENVSSSLEKILDASAHKIDSNTIIIVAH